MRKAKFAKKDLERFNEMIGAYEGAGDKEVTNVLLLKENGTICRRNTLPALHRDGVIVMRCPSAADTGDESDSGSSTASV